MRKLVAAITATFLIFISLPTQAAVSTNLLEITDVNPSIIRSAAALTVSANVNSRDIESVELWLSRDQVTDLTKIAQDVIPLAQAVVLNNKVTIRRNAMPNISAGVYQLVLRSIDGNSVIGEQAIPIVVSGASLPTKKLAVVVPISIPPTSDEITPLNTLLTAGVQAPVDWFIDGDTFKKLRVNQIELAGRITAIAATNPDPNVASKYKLRNFLALATQSAQATFAPAPVKVATWQIRHQVDGEGMRTALGAKLDYVVTKSNSAATKYQFGANEITELTIDPALTDLIAVTSNPIMLRQYVLAASAITDAAAIAPPIGWAPSVDLAAAFFSAVNAAPWLELISVDAISAGLTAKSTSNISGSSPVFSSKHLRNLDQLNRIWRSLTATTLDSPKPETFTLAISTISNWWWLARPSGNQYALQVKQELAGELNKLSISSRNKVVLPATTGSIPITITNKRDTTAKIQVAGQALGTAVVRIETVAVEIPAGAKQVIELPIEVVTPGSIYAQLLIQGQNGETTAMTPTVLQIEVSQYRIVAQLIIFGAFGVLLVLSAISVRGRIKKRREIGDNKPATAGARSDV